MPKRLDPQQVAAFQRDGFVSPIRVLSEDQAAAYRRRFEDYERAHDGWYTLSKGQKIHLLQTWVCELVRNENILDAVEDVLGPDVMCWGTSLFIKNAGDPHYVSWHQDSTYWGLSKPDVATAWIALSPSTPENGCMRVIPGSHTIDQVPHTDTHAEANLLSRGQVVNVEVDESQAVDIVLEPGEMSLHHVRLIHGSEPNPSDQRRIGFAVRYIPPHVHQVNGPHDSAGLVRGTDDFGHFELEPAPAADLDPAAVAWHKKSAELHGQLLYQGTERRAFR